jgi:peptide/nickel transport system substrate-binding protein
VYDTLVSVDGDLNVIPALAESWEQPDETTYVFHLRLGVTFSNGRPLVADDVVGSIERILAPETAAFWANQLGPVASVEAIDDQTVQVTLERPYTPHLRSLAHISAAILPMAELRDGSFDPTMEFIGTGPFIEEEHLQDESWTFSANPSYWREGYPLIDTFIARIISDDNARIAALRDGSIDIALFENVDAPILLEGVEGVNVVEQETTDYYRVDVNAKSADSKLQDQLLRQAFNYAIDRDQIQAVALGGLGVPSGAVAPAYSDSCPPLERDLDRALSLLEEAGVPNPAFELIASPVFPTFPPIAQVIQANLREINATVTIAQAEVGEWFERVFINDPATFDAAMSYHAGYGDPGNILNFYIPETAGFNKGYLLRNEELAQLTDEINQLNDGPERDAKIMEACALIDEDANVIPLVTRPLVVAHREDQIDARIQALEAYVDPLRYVEEYSRIS